MCCFTAFSPLKSVSTATRIKGEVSYLERSFQEMKSPKTHSKNSSRYNPRMKRSFQKRDTRRWKLQAKLCNLLTKYPTHSGINFSVTYLWYVIGWFVKKPCVRNYVKWTCSCPRSACRKIQNITDTRERHRTKPGSTRLKLQPQKKNTLCNIWAVAHASRLTADSTQAHGSWAHSWLQRGADVGRLA